MAHQLYELQQMQMLPLQSKINMTVNRIQEWYSYWASKGEGVYYSWSGGKDSTVLRHIIKTAQIQDNKVDELSKKVELLTQKVQLS